MSAQEIKTLLRNSQIVIDETNFGKDIVSPIGEWRKLAGVDTAEEEPEVLKSKKVYSTDNTMNMQGISGNVNSLLFCPLPPSAHFSERQPGATSCH